jgi:signal transduction histidine kinase
MVCLLIISCLLWVIYRLRLRYLTHHLQERLEARVQERVRIARDLHDTLLQGVQGLMLRFHFATEQLPAEEPARILLRDALDRADIVMQEGRAKVSDLRVEVTSARELEVCLRHAAKSFEVDGSTRINILVIGHARTLWPAVNDELHWIGREALTNAVRHAQATEIVVELTYDVQQLRLRCRDNGLGLNPEIVNAKFKEGHWGIIGIRERAKSLGGKLEFSSTSGGGTEILFSLDARRAYAKADGGLRSTKFARLSLLLRSKPKRITNSTDVSVDQKIETS